MSLRNLKAQEIVDTLLDSACMTFKQVSASPRADARWLLAHAIGEKKCDLARLTQQVPTAEQIRNFQALCKRRYDGEPVAYILGEWDFWSLTLKLTPATLIPRPETEILVEQALQLARRASNPRILDLGTGSGAIALALASELPAASIIAVDRSTDALEIAKHNASELKLPNVSFLHSDWFQALSTKPAQTFDFILANPPYIDPNDPCLKLLQREPKSALVANNAGMADLEFIIKNASTHLSNGGYLLLEHGAEQGTAVRLALDTAGFSGSKTRQDYAGHDRISFGRRTAL